MNTKEDHEEKGYSQITKSQSLPEADCCGTTSW